MHTHKIRWIEKCINAHILEHVVGTGGQYSTGHAAHIEHVGANFNHRQTGHPLNGPPAGVEPNKHRRSGYRDRAAIILRMDT